MAITATTTVHKQSVPIVEVIHTTVTVDGAGDSPVLSQDAIVLAAFTTASTATTAFKVGAVAVSTPDVGGVVALTGNAQDILILPQPVSAASPLAITFDGAGTADLTVVFINQAGQKAGVGV